MAYSKKQIQSTFEEIIKQISNGSSLRQVLRQSKMPSSQTFYLWINEDESKSKQYVRACDERAELIFNQILTIADSTADDIILDQDGKEVTNHNVIQRDRLRVDARKWALSKMNPKKYGDKQSIEMDIKEEKPFKFEIIDGRNN